MTDNWVAKNAIAGSTRMSVKSKKTNKEERDAKTYKGLKMEIENMCEELCSNFEDLDPGIIRNIMAYSRCLVVPGTSIVDKNIFYAQMIQRFNLTDSTLLASMYSVTKGREKHNTKLTVDKYARLICVFLCEDHIPKVDFVFNCYNVKEDGALSKRDLSILIAPMLSKMSDGTNEADEEADDSLRYLVDMMMASIDQNGDGDLSPEEWLELVGRDPMLMQCLGPCLPETKEREEFLKLLRNRTPVDVGALFRYERRMSLCNPDISEPGHVQKLYPVPLELP